MVRGRLLALTVLLTVGAGVGSASAATITVNTFFDDQGAGDGQCSLRKAVLDVDSPGSSQTDCAPAAFGANTIVLPAGRYQLGGSFPPPGQLSIAPIVKNLTITGSRPDQHHDRCRRSQRPRVPGLEWGDRHDHQPHDRERERSRWSGWKPRRHGRRRRQRRGDPQPGRAHPHQRRDHELSRRQRRLWRGRLRGPRRRRWPRRLGRRDLQHRQPRPEWRHDQQRHRRKRRLGRRRCSGELGRDRR